MEGKKYWRTYLNRDLEFVLNLWKQSINHPKSFYEQPK